MQVQLLDKMGTDLTVVNAARVSYAKIKETFDDKDEKLIKYLAEHEHWSPFAHALNAVQDQGANIRCEATGETPSGPCVE